MAPRDQRLDGLRAGLALRALEAPADAAGRAGDGGGGRLPRPRDGAEGCSGKRGPVPVRQLSMRGRKRLPAVLGAAASDYRRA